MGRKSPPIDTPHKETNHGRSKEVGAEYNCLTRRLQPGADLLKKAGCFVEENRVRVPAHLVEWALRAAPSRIMMYDRNGKPVMPLGDRISTFGTGSDCLNVSDHRTGEKRKALLQDVVDGVRDAAHRFYHVHVPPQ